MMYMWWGSPGYGPGMPFMMFLMPLFLLFFIGLIFLLLHRGKCPFYQRQEERSQFHKELIDEIRQLRQAVEKLTDKDNVPPGPS